jgi:hypothetical protein
VYVRFLGLYLFTALLLFVILIDTAGACRCLSEININNNFDAVRLKSWCEQNGHSFNFRVDFNFFFWRGI